MYVIKIQAKHYELDASNVCKFNHESFYMYKSLPPDIAKQLDICKYEECNTCKKRKEILDSVDKCSANINTIDKKVINASNEKEHYVMNGRGLWGIWLMFEVWKLWFTSKNSRFPRFCPPCPTGICCATSDFLFPRFSCDCCFVGNWFLGFIEIFVRWKDDVRYVRYYVKSCDLHAHTHTLLWVNAILCHML